MRRVIESSIKAGEQVTRTAERILETDAPMVHLPKYVTDLRDAAKMPRAPGEPNLFEDAVKKWESQVSRLGQGASRAEGEFTIQTATKQLITDLRKAKPDQIDKVIDRWVLEKARYQARVVARNEAVEAFRDVTVRNASEQPWVVALRWTLSGEHPRPDICDCYASADSYGFGPGGYPASDLPARHPSCLCSLVSIADPHYLKRETAKLRGEEEPPKPWLTGVKETPEQWLLKQSEATRLQMIGPTRNKLLAQGRRVLDKGASNFRPVYKADAAAQARYQSRATCRSIRRGSSRPRNNGYAVPAPQGAIERLKELIQK